jgi:short-subunit dehydrogenase
MTSDHLSRHRLRISAACGPWALVTGASEGIGRALALEIAACGVNVVLSARREHLLSELARDIGARFGVETRVLAGDLSDPAAVEPLLAQTDDLDIGLLVACAGFGTSGDVIDSDLATELNMIDVNCGATFAATRHFAPRLARRGRGGIILMSSLVAFQGVARAANYAATKAYVQVLAEGLSRELAAKGVDVLAAAPGPVRSGFAKRAAIRLINPATPERVAREILPGLGRRTTVRPTLLNRVLQFNLSIRPRPVRTHIMQQVMAGMTKHDERVPDA